MDNVVLLCWIVKDLGWVLLCPLAMAAALVGLVLQGCHLLGQLHVVSRAEWAHNFAAFGWFFGSSVWMIDQFFYETTVHTDRTSPWYHGAFFSRPSRKIHRWRTYHAGNQLHRYHRPYDFLRIAGW
jgi:hypothetical protein